MCVSREACSPHLREPQASPCCPATSPHALPTPLACPCRRSGCISLLACPANPNFTHLRTNGTAHPHARIHSPHGIISIVSHASDSSMSISIFHLYPNHSFNVIQYSPPSMVKILLSISLPRSICMTTHFMVFSYLPSLTQCGGELFVPLSENGLVSVSSDGSRNGLASHDPFYEPRAS